ncbi:putative vacuole protein [Mycena alexandri]|uniref:Phosphatidylglycerol/phosphatidylinositol transfer protein n=1 Tax=Mycena alexandri TaxID=1745969 RepID=A0AAD6SD66_9AGAR|nr:putative vacuole protein [Mycena alexandri]
MRISTPTAFILAFLTGMGHGRSSQQAFELSSGRSTVSATARDWSWSDCGLPTDAILLKSIEVSPDPPAPGKNLTITVKGTANQRIEDGAYVNVVVKLGLVKLLQKNFDVCEEARNANASVTCPVEKGDYEVVQTVPLPREIPPAKFTVQVRGFTADNDDMVCLDIRANFKP